MGDGKEPGGGPGVEVQCAWHCWAVWTPGYFGGPEKSPWQAAAGECGTARTGVWTLLGGVLESLHSANGGKAGLSRLKWWPDPPQQSLCCGLSKNAGLTNKPVLWLCSS